MTKNGIHIMPSDTTPEILLNSEGNIKMKGRSVNIYKSKDLDEINKWVDEYVTNPSETTEFILAFEYINSFGISFLVNILRKFQQMTLKSGKLNVRWYYEEEDEDTLESGHYISATLGIPFIFMVTSSIRNI